MKKALQIIRKFLKILYKYKFTRKCCSYTEPLYVNGLSSATDKTKLGKNVHFNGMSIVGCGKVYIGDNFHSGINCQIISENHNYEGERVPYDATLICKDVFIGDNVWIGNNVIIMGGVIVGDGAIIQAGSTVVSNVPKCTIAGGHPAKVFSKRDEIHYEELVSEKLFF